MDHRRAAEYPIKMATAASEISQIVCFCFILKQNAKVQARRHNREVVESGIACSDVHSLLNPTYCAPEKAENDSEIWRIERSVGSWTLTVSYEENETVHTASRKYSKSVFGK